MNEPEPLTLQEAWTPFMCPACRGLFRAPRNQTGEVTCPLCESKIKIEHPKEETHTPTPAQTLPPENSASNHAEGTQPQAKRRRKVQKKKTASTSTQWDHNDSENSANQRNSRGIILTFLFIFTAVLATAIFFLLKERFNNSRIFGNEQRISSEDLTTPSSTSNTESLIQLGKDDIVLARQAASKFLNCETIEELAPLIRHSERVMPLIRKHYQNSPYQPSPSLTIDETGITQISKKFTSFQVVLADYSSRPIAVEITDNGPLVDWESWVGYCGTPWETFIEQKTKQPTLVRVRANQDFYFNFNFSDSSKWTCYRLARSSDETVLFGYLPVDSPLNSQLPNSKKPPATHIIKIKFPEQAVSGDQVLITDIIQEGWVLGL